MRNGDTAEHAVRRLEATFLGVLGLYPGVVSAYLFGSQREHRAHAESDVDVGVLLDRAASPTSNDRVEARLKLSTLLEYELAPRRADVVVLNDIPPEFAARIATTGLRVVCRSGSTDHAFRRDSQLRAADLQPVLRRTRDIKLRTILGS